MKPPRELNVYLQDILEGISRIEKYTNEMTIDAFDEDLKTKDAVIHCLEVIGEAVKNIPQDFRKQHAEIPWKEIAGMRDVLIHEYFGVLTDKLWETIERDIPELKKKLQEIGETTRL